MRRQVLTVLVFSFVSLVSCENKGDHKAKNSGKEQIENIHEDDNSHWSYEGETGPEHWAEIERNSDCDGQSQSPINILTKDAVVDDEVKSLKIHYSKSTKIHDVVNNGHTIQYNFEAGDYIIFKGDKFELKQIHFHEAAEHTINGIRYPMELHMVHVNSQNQYAVLAVMVEEGESSESFDFLENFLPFKQGENIIVDASFNLNDNLPDDIKYYYYVGSLTTPPCTEGVNWFVFKENIVISIEQVKVLQNAMPLNNYRNENPLNGRIVQTNF